MKFQYIVLFSIHCTFAYSMVISTGNEILDEKEITVNTTSSSNDILIIPESVSIHSSSSDFEQEKLDDTTKAMEFNSTSTLNNELKESFTSEQEQITSTELNIEPTSTDTSTYTSTYTPINNSTNTSTNTTLIENDEIVPAITINLKKESNIANDDPISINNNNEQSINNLDINVEEDQSEDNFFQTTSNKSYIVFGLAGSAAAATAGIFIWVKRSKLQDISETPKMEIIYKKKMYFFLIFFFKKKKKKSSLY